MPVRLLHAADLHLDCPFSGTPKQRERLRELHRQTIHALTETALKLQPDAVLLAGDTAHQEDLTYASSVYLSEELGQILGAGIPVFICRGNHDPALRMSRLRLPEGCTVFSGMQPVTVPLTDASGRVIARITGWGFDTPSAPRLPLEDAPAADPELVHIGLAHTQVTDTSAGAGYAPISVRELTALGYDYWALGHQHKRETLESRIHYPGNLMGANPGEPGPKGVSLVTLAKGVIPQIEFIPLAPVQWAQVVLASHPEASSLEDAEQTAQAALLRAAEETSGAQLCARVLFTGQWGCAEELSGPSGEASLSAMGISLTRKLDALLIECAASVRKPVSVEEFEGQPHLLGEMLDLTRKLEDDDALADAILERLNDDKISLAGLAGVTRSALPEASRGYIRSLLPGLRELLCRDMTQKEDE